MGEAVTDADRLREQLSHAGLSQREFARRMEVQRSLVRAWCSGAESIPRYAWIGIEHMACVRRSWSYWSATDI